MKAFLKNIIVIFLAVLAMLFALDLAYTKIYSTSEPRTKFQVFRSFKGKHIDYIFLGSSRVENGIVPSVIEEITGKTAYNFGFQASKLNDIFTILKLLKEYDIKHEKVFIQVDYIFDMDGRSNVLPHEMAPFLHDNDVTENYYSGESDFYLLKYAPFYRYNAFDHKIGLREVILNLSKKKTNVTATKGYMPLFGSKVDTIHALPAMIQDRNATFDAIRKYCNDNKIDAVFYCAPFWKGSKNLDYIRKLKMKIPELKDFSTVIQDSALFQNNSHLNDSGAREFSKILSKELLTE